jgi:hypothetical protein
LFSFLVQNDLAIAFTVANMPFNREQIKQKAAQLAAKGVFVGTSSWKYEGWLGQIYTPSRYELCAANDHQRGNRPLGDSHQRCSHQWHHHHQSARGRLLPTALKRDKSRQPLRNVLVEDFLHGQGNDDLWLRL